MRALKSVWKSGWTQFTTAKEPRATVAKVQRAGKVWCFITSGKVIFCQSISNDQRPQRASVLYYHPIQTNLKNTSTEENRYLIYIYLFYCHKTNCYNVHLKKKNCNYSLVNYSRIIFKKRIQQRCVHYQNLPSYAGKKKWLPLNSLSCCRKSIVLYPCIHEYVYSCVFPCFDNGASSDLLLMACHGEIDPPQHWHQKSDCLMVPNLGRLSLIDGL